jgi:hypothetical protein
MWHAKHGQFVTLDKGHHAGRTPLADGRQIKIKIAFPTTSIKARGAFPGAKRQAHAAACNSHLRYPQRVALAHSDIRHPATLLVRFDCPLPAWHN